MPWSPPSPLSPRMTSLRSDENPEIRTKREQMIKDPKLTEEFIVLTEMDLNYLVKFKINVFKIFFHRIKVTSKISNLATS